MSIFYSGALLAGAFGNLIAAGILDGLAGKRGIAAWRWLYIIEGTSMSVYTLSICRANFSSYGVRGYHSMLLLTRLSSNLASAS